MENSRKYNLSILIPARNEQFLAKTVENILANKEGKTEILIGLDGAWANPVIKDHPDVTILHHCESVGQRAMTNELAMLSKAKYVMKADAHCAFDKGFDVKMIKAFEKAGDNVVMSPVMRNLHAFDWVCPDGHRRYQGRSGVCLECGKETKQEIMWIAKENPQSTSFCFDSEPHFQYFREFKKTDEYKRDLPTGLTESMSLQGSCFMLTRENYWELNICDEAFGSWGSQGIEVACKFWLSGGRVLINHETYYAHMFRTQGGDFGFPYPQQESKVQQAKSYARNLFIDGKWEKQIKPLSWLIEKFNPPEKYWSKESRELIRIN